ncbi:hypothetical protein ACX0G7_17850 [Flavitalea antarctica]
MKRITVALFAFLQFALFSCNKNIDVQMETPPQMPAGTPTPVGIADSTPVSQKIIGAEGGTLLSSDSRIKITIPAGAFSSAQQVSIQSISNHNPMAVKKAYRLQPHNVKFSKPATIEFFYSDEDIVNMLPEALGIAYQDSTGIWQKQGTAVVDKSNQSVKVATTHFSDWSLFESFYLLNSATVVPVNGTSQLEVFTTDDILVPLVPGKEIPMGKKISLTPEHIKEWKLAGAGSLQASGSKALYKAPPQVPGSPNPVGISVNLDLKQRGKFLLVTQIEVANDDGEIEIRVAGSGWLKKTASPAVKFAEGYYAIADSDGDTEGSYILITWMGGTGTHPYKAPENPTGTHAHYLRNGGNNYVCSYMSGEKIVASGGGVTITSMGEEDGFIKGTFTIKPAGYGPQLKNTIDIEGKFRVRKGW